MTTLVFVTSNKGGVGKSLFSILLADYVLRSSAESANLLVCADCEQTSGMGTFWNFWNQNDPNRHVFAWNLAVSEGYEQMMNDVSEMKDKIVIIDSGASMLQTMCDNADFLNTIGQMTEYSIKTAFIIGPLIDSSVAARMYIKAFKKFSIESHFVLIAPTPAESKLESFNFNNQDDIQKALLTHNMKQHFIPYIQQNHFNSIMKNFILPSHMLDEKTTPFGTRMKINLWLKTHIDPIISEILS